MSLKDKLKKGILISGAIATLCGGCSMQQRREKVTWVAIPFVPTYVKIERFKTDKCKKIEEALEVNASIFFGNGEISVKQYGENMTYLGKQIIKIKSDWGNYKISAKAYDKDGNLIKQEQEIPEDISDINHLNINR
jgi:hypothetical protein